MADMSLETCFLLSLALLACSPVLAYRPLDKPMAADLTEAELVALDKQIHALQDFFADHPSALDLSSAVPAPNQRRFRRTFHAKGFCLKGEVRIDSGSAPAALQQGIFSKTNEGKTFPVWVRWSNGLGTVNADAMPDVRGMAVKIFPTSDTSDTRKTLDLLATNFPVPTTNTLQALVDFARTMQHAGWTAAFKKASEGAKYFFQHPRTLAVFLKSVLAPPRSFAREQFWSGSPYKIGSAQVKFNFAPTPDNDIVGDTRGSNHLLDFHTDVVTTTAAADMEADAPPKELTIVHALRQWRLALTKATTLALDKNYLLNDMRDRVAAKALTFKLQLQSYKDDKTTPLEDLFTEWKETVSPSVAVATITLPKQKWDEQLQAACEEAQFNPGHVGGFEGHAPLGHLNTGRVHAYTSSGDYRNQHNKHDL